MMRKQLPSDEANLEDEDDLELLDPSVANAQVLQYEQTNPFFVKAVGSNLRYTKMKIFAEEYQSVNILCLLDDVEMTNQTKNLINLFYQPDTEISELIGQKKFITSIKGPFDLLHLTTIRKGLVIIKKELLEHFNHESFESNPLAEKELVYLMLESKESDVRSWMKIYEKESNLNQFIKQKIFTSAYELNDSIVDNHLISLISQVNDFKYWQNKYNCSLSINNAFSNRKFNLAFTNKWKISVEEIEKELDKLLKNFKENKSVAVASNYPTELTENNEKNTVDYNSNSGLQPKNKQTNATIDPLEMKPYVDGSKLDMYSYFGVIQPNDLTIDYRSVNELLTKHTLNEREKYHLICNLLASKKYCHYVANSGTILESNKELFEKYKPVFKYVFGYAWITMYMEESLRKSRTVSTDRYVFDIETASRLPVFPFTPNSPHDNPYFTYMVSDNLTNINNGIGCVKQSANYQRGIVDLAEFRRRFNIFVSGKETLNLFEGVNWSNMAVTGGCMAAILPKSNPLMALFQSTESNLITEEELNRFYQEYYNNSDIDIACNFNNMLDFIEHVRSLKQAIYKNLANPDIKESEIIISPLKTLVIYINDNLLKKKCESNELPFTYDDVINNKNTNAVKFYFYELYQEHKKQTNQSNMKILGLKINSDEYFEIVNYCKYENTIILVNNASFETEIIPNRTPSSNSGIECVFFMKEQDGTTFIKFSETLKCKINSIHMKHSIEAFRISEVEFFSSVAKFHLPCVRAYYNGTTCYMLPSAITAYHTMMNIDFKYFVGSHDPISIIDKYRKRGFGTILNKAETNQYLSYLMAIGNHKKAYDIKGTADIKKIIGCLDVNNDYYKPRKLVPEDFPVDPTVNMNYKTPTMQYLESRDAIITSYKDSYPKYSAELINLTTINSSGQINPFKPWVIDAGYDFLTC